MAGIRELVVGKTCIVITHDAAIARMATRVLDVRDGRIVEREPIVRPTEGTPRGKRRAGARRT